MTEYDIRDLFSGLAGISVKRMFGGKGVYHEGIIFALEVGGEILLKADGESAPEFEAAGCRQWIYTRPGRVATAMPYWSIPDEALDDPDMLVVWARKAIAASLRTRKQK